MKQTVVVSGAVLKVTLTDGSPVSIRLLTPTDRAHLLDGFGKLSAASRRSRFFSAMPVFNDDLLNRLADLDGFRHVAVGAFHDTDEIGNGIGVARSIQLDATEPAELAVTVIDDYHGRRIGELLLRVLIAVWQEQLRQRLQEQLGDNMFVASILRENRAAVKTFRRLGAITQTDPDDPTIVLAQFAGSAISRPEGWPTELTERVCEFARAVS